MARYLRSLTFNLALALLIIGCVLAVLHGPVAWVFFAGLDWQTALLLGAIVGSTDAAAVFALLTRSGVMLNERVASTLEIESGINDPMAVYLTLAFIAVIGAGGSDPSPWAAMGMAFVQQFGWGVLLGIVSGFLMAELLKLVASRDAGGGILASRVRQFKAPNRPAVQ